MDVRGFVVEAALELSAGIDPAAVGAAVTGELCGHWDHDGPCRWPHNNSIDAEREPASFRTLFIAEEAEASEVGDRIEAALRDDPRWRVASLSSRDAGRSERALAEGLASSPRAG